MSALKPVEDMAKYYQEFHHKCITWYLTILGFFIAGVVAAPDGTPKAKIWIIPILVFSLVIAGFFSYYIYHYGARIEKLNQYLNQPESALPTTWRVDHKAVSFGLHGSGAYFFLSIVLAMQGALFCLAILKFFF